MGEVAQMLGENASAVRYWSNYFEKFIHPQRNAKGNRLYHPEDIDTLKQVQFVMMVDARQNAYPAWTYIFDRYMPANNNHDPYTYHFQMTYDAWTGEPVW